MNIISQPYICGTGRLCSFFLFQRFQTSRKNIDPGNFMHKYAEFICIFIRNIPFFCIFSSLLFPFSVGNKTFRWPSRSDMMLNSLEYDRAHLFICRNFSAFKAFLTLKQSSQRHKISALFFCILTNYNQTNLPILPIFHSPDSKYVNSEVFAYGKQTFRLFFVFSRMNISGLTYSFASQKYT